MNSGIKLGAIFPQTEIGIDPQDIREYTLAVERLDFDYILAFDHVLGADVSNRPSWVGPYTQQHSFHEPFVLFAYMAAITSSIELATGIIILPQRQTALVAKQAATLDVLSNGRLRLGIGIGWNSVEYEALGEDFSNRGIRSEEQVDVMRALWTNQTINYDGHWHKITSAGINPLPIQKPIPIWFGGKSEKVLERIGRIGDGWIASGLNGPNKESSSIFSRIHEYTKKAGRKPEDVGLETWVSAKQGPLELLADQALEWQDAGATRIGLTTMGAGYSNIKEHIQALEYFKKTVHNNN